MVRLVPMNETEFQAYLDMSLPGYAQEHVAAGNWSAEGALERARQQVLHLLPEGLHTEGHSFYTIEDEEQAIPLGVLWVAVEERAGIRRAFVYDIVIHEEYRRQGYGTQAFQAMEERVRELGVDTISLHVFGHNRPAREMYTKLGYVETGVMMSKCLEAARAEET